MKLNPSSMNVNCSIRPSCKNYERESQLTPLLNNYNLSLNINPILLKHLNIYIFFYIAAIHFGLGTTCTTPPAAWVLNNPWVSHRTTSLMTSEELSHSGATKRYLPCHSTLRFPFIFYLFFFSKSSAT